MEDRAQPLVDLDAPAQALGEGAGAGRRDHELLEVGRAGGVLAAVQDVQHGHRQGERVAAAERGVERQAAGGGRGMRGGQTDAEHGVGAQAAFVRRAVERRQRPVQPGLIGGVEAAGRCRDLAVDMADGGADALAAVPVGIAVAELDRLVPPGAGAAGDDRAAAGAAFERHFDLDGGVSPAVEDLAAGDGRDFGGGGGHGGIGERAASGPGRRAGPGRAAGDYYRPDRFGSAPAA